MGQGEWSQVPPPLRDRLSEEAVKFYRSLSTAESLEPNLRYEAAVGHRSIGTLYTTRGAPAEAEASFRRSITILDRLASEHAANPRYRHQLAWSLFNLGRTLRHTGRADEAKGPLGRAVGLYETLIGQTPDSYDYRNEMAMCC